MNKARFRRLAISYYILGMTIWTFVCRSIRLVDMGKENHVFPTVRRHIEFINNKMWHIKGGRFV